MNFNKEEASRTITLGNGYKFDSSDTYTDESKSALTDARGFVYSVGIQMPKETTVTLYSITHLMHQQIVII